MKTIEFAGVNFSEEMINVLQEWFGRNSENGIPDVQTSIRYLDKTQAFLLRNWDGLNVTGEEEKVKEILIGLQDIKDYLSVFSQKGGAV